MLQFYLAKIIKRSEFYYADFDYQRYLLNLPNNFQPFSFSIRYFSIFIRKSYIRYAARPQ